MEVVRIRPQGFLRAVIGLLATAILGLSSRGAVANPEGDAFFENQVRPLLAARCLDCHGSKKQWASLRLDSAEAILTGGDSGPAVVPGDPSESELYFRISSDDVDVRMPPENEGEPLTPEQVQIFARWIEMGAPWPQSAEPTSTEARAEAQRNHWAFQPLAAVAPPSVEDTAWPRGAVDQFVLAKLKAEQLRPAPEADRRTLIRRASYDLTGLPPTAAEVADFEADPAADAYEKLIERLLASPHYGEQWGRHWLDIARYADTKGYVYGREEKMFVHSSVYRDWVIRALNDDMAYNRFVMLQLAADQAAPEDPSALAAMGFLTLGRRFLGVTPDIIDDRIDVVTRGLLGLTVGCARCHDHKYDPIPTADYYSLYSVFKNCSEPLVPVPAQPGAPAPTAEFTQGLAERKQKLAETTAQLRGEAEDRIRQRIDGYLLAQTELEKYPALAFNMLLNKEQLNPSSVHRWDDYLSAAKAKNDPIFVPWFAFKELAPEEFSNRTAEVTERLKQAEVVIHPAVAAAFAEPPATLVEVAQRYKQVLLAADEQWKQLCAAATAAGQPLPKSLPDPHDEALRQMMYAPGSPCVIPDEPIINTEPYWDIDSVTKLWGLQGDVDRWILQAPDSAPHAVVLHDSEAITETRIFRRGNPINPGEVAPRQFLEVLAGPNRQPFAHGSGRLEMAQAIIDPTNPLTARVWVNRVWMHHFGQGLVTSASDFGMRADAPSHPELLDWLASEFMRNGWSTKWLHRTMMQSATYRQMSTRPADAATSAQAEMRDPDNRLLSRMNPRRLSFEEYRDTLGALSGELDMTMGGRGVNLFGPGSALWRRSIYGEIDRQFLPTVLRTFDFANPDLHTGQRADTIVPQQALFALNGDLLTGRAQVIVRRLGANNQPLSAEPIRLLYQAIFQRDPTSHEIDRAIEFLQPVREEPVLAQTTTPSLWSYGYGEIDPTSQVLKSFEPLPYFNGGSWQGGANWPDASLGWVRLTADGGHPGDDLQHAAVRRWTAPATGRLQLTSEFIHEPNIGDGVRYWIISSRHGVLKTDVIRASRRQIDLDGIDVQAGDTLDMIVDINGELNSDQFLWSPVLRFTDATLASGPKEGVVWNSADDFSASSVTLTTTLSPWEQLAQLLLMSNELMFVD